MCQDSRFRLPVVTSIQLLWLCTSSFLPLHFHSIRELKQPPPKYAARQAEFCEYGSMLYQVFPVRSSIRYPRLCPSSRALPYSLCDSSKSLRIHKHNSSSPLSCYSRVFVDMSWKLTKQRPPRPIPKPVQALPQSHQSHQTQTQSEASKTQSLAALKMFLDMSIGSICFQR